MLGLVLFKSLNGDRQQACFAIGAQAQINVVKAAR